MEGDYYEKQSFLVISCHIKVISCKQHFLWYLFGMMQKEKITLKEEIQVEEIERG